MLDKDLRSKFPDDFLWGASIASYQVEGNASTQWTRWEGQNAEQLAKNAERDNAWLPIWKDIAAQATQPQNYIAGSAVEHYNRYHEDFALARQMGLNAMRVGFEWARFFPSVNALAPEAVDHYNAYLRDVQSQGLVPVINLFHWTEPQWFTDLGGFSKRKNLKHWDEFIEAILQHVDLSGVKYILTINEANTFSTMGYLVGQHAPGEKNIFKAWAVYRNLARAHRRAYALIKARYPEIQVSFAHQYNKIIAQNRLGLPYAWFQRWWWNWGWIRWCKNFDFVGVNYYFSDYWTGREKHFDINRKPPVSDLGWHMEPSGVKWVVDDIARRWPGKSIMITENGVADMHDQWREWWIAETIRVLADARGEGRPVIGYMHWSLLDNFEWACGWWPKFGLIEVDRTTMKRTVKKSAEDWGGWLRNK